MANYLNKEGILYTQEEIEAAALENNVDIDTILADNELSLEKEKPGKPQDATAKKPVVASKKQKQGSPSGNTSSGWNTKSQPKYGIDAITDTFYKQKQAQKKAAEKKAAEKKAAEKKVAEKKSKAVVNSFVESQSNSANPFAIDTPLNVTDPFNTGANITKKPTTKKVKEPDFNASRLRLAAQMGEADPNSVPGSFGYKTFQAAKKKEAEAAAVKEDEKVDFESRMSGIVLRNNNEAKKWYEDNLNNSQLTESDYTDIDTYIESEIARNNTLQNTDGTGRYEINAAQSQEARMRAGVSGNIVGTKKYQAFYDETKKIKNKLKQAGKLNDYSEEEILEQAAALWKKNEIVRRKESKFRDSLEETTNIDKVAKDVVNDYLIKKATKEANDFVKETVFKESLDRTSESYINQIKKIDKQLKPKGYKFTSQQELDEQNALIVRRNNLIKDINDNEELIDRSINKINKLSDNVDDLSLQGDMFSRDYTNLGMAKKLGLNVAGMGGDIMGLGLYLNQGTEMVYDALGLEELIGMENPITYLKNLVAAGKAKIEDRLTYEFAKPRTGSTEAYLEQAGDLFISQAPNLLLMALTGGGSTAEKVVAEQLAKKAVPSLLARTGKFAKDYLTLNAQTGTMAGISTGGKYLEMINEERNGYYTEDGKFIKPDYNAFQLIVAPAAFGYVEGVFEKSTGKVLERGKSFFKTAAKKAPEEWFNWNIATTKKLLKQAGVNVVGDQVEEQLSEQLTNFGQNTINKVILGKEVSLFENTGTVFKDTAMLTTMLSGIPIIAGAAIRPFMSRTTAKQLDTNARQLASIMYKLDNGTDLSDINREALQKEKQKIEAQSTALLQKTISDIDAMPVNTFNYINKSQAKIADLINKANQINEGDGDAKSKAEDLEILRGEYISEKMKLNTLVSGVENVKTFGKPISSIGRMQLIELNTERFIANMDETTTDDEKNNIRERIENKVKAVYKNEGIDLKEARETEFNENLAAAQKLAEAEDVTVILAEDYDDASRQMQALIADKKITEEDANILGFKGSDGKIVTSSLNGKDYIVINKQQSINQKAVTVGSHEFLHKLLQKTLSKAGAQIALGQQLKEYLLASNPELFMNEKVLGRLLANYRNASEGIKNEEILTLFSDALLNGNIKYNESFFTKLGDTIRRYLQDIGLISIKFDSGRDVFNFIRDYNNTIQKGGEAGKAIKKLFKEGAGGKLTEEGGAQADTSNLSSKSIEERMDKLDDQLASNEIDLDKYESEMKKLEQEEFEESKKTYEEEKKVVKKETTKKDTTKKEPTEVSEAAAKAKAKLDAIGNDPKGFNPNNPAIYDELDKMVKVKSRNYKTSNGTVIDLTNKNKGGLDGFNMEEMTSYVTMSMLPYINKFDPSRNDSLYGYINAQLANRMKAALKSGQVADVVFTEDVTEMTKLSNDDVEVKTPTLPERKKYQNILESGVFSPAVIEDVQAKILPIIRTLKSRVDEKTTLNRTTAPIINEIRTEIGKQADIDIKRAMGGKEDGQLRKFLLINKKPILENMTTTWLMGKDNGKTVSGGMPFAIQKRINGQWTSFPDWIGKKVDRESVETDLAGRTSGAELVRRLPNAANNVPDDVFLDSIIDPVTGLPLRGRKESLAKAMSEELAFDLISDDMLSGGPIYQALQKNQEILGAELGKVTVENINRLAERGNIKYSLSADLILDLENNSAALGKAIVNLTNFETVNVKNMLSTIFANDWDENQINEVTNVLKVILTRNYKFWEGAAPLEYEKNTGFYFANISKEKDFGEDVWKKLGADVSVAKFYRDAENVKKLQELNQNFMVDLLLKEGDKVGTTMLNSMWAPTTINGGNIISLFRPDKGKSAKAMFNKALNQARKTAFGKNTNNISETVLATNYSGFKKINKVHDNIIDGTIDIKKDQIRSEAARKMTVYAAKWWGEKLTDSEIGLTSSYQAAMFTLLSNNANSVIRSAAPVVGIIYAGKNAKYIYEHTKPARVVLAQLIDKYINKNDSITEDEIFENYKVLAVPEELSKRLDKSGVKQMMDPFYFIKDKTDFSRYYSLFENDIIQSINIFKAQQQNIQNEKATLNNLNQERSSKSNGITTVSDYINDNNSRRLDTETSYELLDKLAKNIEDYWGILPNDIILGMNRAIDYAVDVIEDREGSGFLMEALNQGLNIETVKNAEKQLNQFIQNNMQKNTMYSKSSENYTTIYAGAPIGKNLKEIGRKGVNFFATDIREANEYARMNDGKVQEFVIGNSNLIDEETAINKIKELNLEPVNKEFTVDESSFYELIDPRFENSLSRKDIDTLFENLRKDGIKAISYTDGAQVVGKTTKSIAVIDTSVLSNPTTSRDSKSLDFQFNDILERNTGVEAFTKVSDVVAKRTGIKKNKLSFFVPPSADDFRGLTTYMFAGKGKQGEQDQEFFDKNLTVPYVKGINTLDSVRQSIRKEYKMLLNNFPDIKKKLEKLTPDKGFTYDQAVRVYLWSNSGKEVPGLSRTDKNKLLYFVKQNPDLVAFANALSITGRQDGGWIDPSTTWDSETIISDLHNITEGAGRKKYLEEFIENADAIFTKENLNKIQSIYGTNTREALEDSLYRMKNGKNRPEGTDRITNKWMNWINGSTAAIMFFNTRSALLQTISAMNFLNWSDNNPYMAGKAFINQKQYWADFAMIINSDKLKERRSGLKADVTQAEIANAANSTKNKFNGVISYLQKIGFTPTQAADSFSIAVSGATFYRNRVNTYLKAGNTVQEAEEKAFNDFSIITDQSMQSADPMYVSKQQTTALGRIILAFGNTPMQYNRLIKKAALDLVNKRGDWKTNISKIVYYGALQNMLFSFLQSALFIPLGYDDDEEPDFSKMTKEEKKAYEKLQKKYEDKVTNMLNGMADTLLRGSGVYGAAIATIKNTVMEYFKQEEKEMFADHAYTVLALTSVSPPISSKARKLYGAIRISKFEKDVITERGWEVTRDGKLNLSPNYRIAGNIAVATTNLPLDRVVEKVNNMAEVMDSRNTKLQRTALALGWKDWELNVKNEENETIKAAAKEKRKEEGIEKAIETRYENKQKEMEKYKAMSIQEKIAYKREKAADKKEKLLKRRERLLKRKRKMG